MKTMPLYKKIGKSIEIYYAKTKSHVRYIIKKDHVLILCIRSHRTGDAHNLMEELYQKYPDKLFKLDVIISRARKRALAFWKSEGFKIVIKVQHPRMRFYKMVKKQLEKRLSKKEKSGKFRFIPYQRFIILLHIDKNPKPFYSDRFCRKAIALSEAENMTMLAGINAGVYDTKKKRFIDNGLKPVKIKVASIFDNMEIS